MKNHGWRAGGAALAMFLLLASGLAATDWELLKGGLNEKDAVQKAKTYRKGVFANNVFVVVGDDGLIETSADGRTWTTRNSGQTHNIYDVCYANGLFVAVGKNGLICTSPNGSTWTERAPYTINGLSLCGVTYGSGLFVAAGYGGLCRTSPDGIAWTTRVIVNSADKIDCEDVTFGNGVFVAVGASGHAAYSPDGISWHAPVVPPATNENFKVVCHNGSIFAAVGRNSQCWTSVSGSSWTNRSPPLSPRYFYCVNYCRDKLFGGGDGNVDGCSFAVVSANNGASWVQEDMHGLKGEMEYSTLAAAFTGVTAGGSEVAILAGFRGVIFYNTYSGMGDGKGCSSHIPQTPLHLTYPNGGQFLKSGTTVAIKWTATSAVTDPVRLRYSTDGGATWPSEYTIASGLTPSLGTYNWKVPALQSTKCRVKVVAQNAAGSPYDISDANFEIGDSPSGDQITITSPLTGDVLQAGVTHTITWGETRSFTSVTIKYTIGDNVWDYVVPTTSDTGSYVWSVPNVNTPIAQVVIVGYYSGGSASYKTGYFTITNGDVIGITEPVSGEQLTGGTLYTVTWIGNKVFDKVTLKYTLGNNAWASLLDAQPDSGSYAWIVPNVTTAEAQLAIKGINSDGSVTPVFKTGFFSITASMGLQVISPAADDGWVRGLTYPVSWTRSGEMVETVNIELYKAGVKLRDIAVATANDQSELWTVPTDLELGDDYMVRVVTTDGVYAGQSGQFGLTPPPSLTVTSPNADSGYIVGTPQLIAWSKVGKQSARVVIELLRDGALLRTINGAASNSGSYNWAVPADLEPGTGYVVRVTTQYNEASDDSEPFRLLPATIQVVDPAMSTLWQAGTAQTITWQKLGGMDDHVRIVLYQNNAPVATISESTDNSGTFAWTIPAELGVGSSNPADWGLNNFLPRNSGGNNGVVDDGSPYWTVPLDPSLGGVYMLKIITLDGRVTGSSDLFIIGAAG